MTARSFSGTRPGRMTAVIGGLIAGGLALAVGVAELRDARAAAPASQAGQDFYTCPMHPNIIQAQPGTCPICGMDLVRKHAPALPDAKPAAAPPAAAAPGGHDHGAPGKQLYTCGMHPNVIQDHPGTCPICGMDLTPVKASAAAAGAIAVDPVMVQNMGVRVAKVERGSLTRRVRTIGEIDVAEDQVSVVNLRYSGWIDQIFVDQTGQAVKRGQPLFAIYSPELVSAQKEYLIAYNTGGKDSELTRAAAERLRLWDIPQAVLDRVAQQQNVDRTLVVSAPRSGYVLHKNVVEGARVVAGTDLYRIGDLKTIWVNAEVYEFDAPWIQLGQDATMELSYQRGRTFSGKVNYIYPTLNKPSRTLKVRLEFDNPGIALKPGMFATVWIAARHKDGVLRIPTESILHTGERQLVFVTSEVGKYQPREIVTGLVGDGHLTEVLSGLAEGETVVTSGQFLLDSESQLQEAMQKLMATRLQVQPQASPDSARGHGE